MTAPLIDPRLPLIDLHRHLDGNVRLSTILELGKKHGVKLPGATIDELRPHVQVMERQPGVMAFISKMLWMTAVLADPDACRRIAHENVEDAKRENIDYVELRFSPWFMAAPHGLDPTRVVAAVVEGAAAGAQATGVRVNLIGILSRTYGPQTAGKELEALLTQREHITWEALRLLGAERIGHGVRAMEDPALLDFLVENQIGVEANLTSNVQTSTVPDLASHPLRKMLAHGLLASINTDDPAVSGIDLRHEFEVAAPEAGLSPAQSRQAQVNALETAFLAADTREKLRKDERGMPNAKIFTEQAARRSMKG